MQLIFLAWACFAGGILILVLGKKPKHNAWLGLVLPARRLLVCYQMRLHDLLQSVDAFFCYIKFLSFRNY